MIYITTLIWNLTLLIGSAYIVFVLDHSVWWFLVAYLMHHTIEVNKKNI